MLNKTFDTYESREIFLSFNGGKDCTVLLHMFANLFKKRHPNESLLCLYIQPENSFDEIEEFIVECQKHYPIKMEIIRGTVKSALFGICQRYPHLKAVVMGCRHTDPYCSNLNEFQVRKNPHINKRKVYSTHKCVYIRVHMHVISSDRSTIFSAFKQNTDLGWPPLMRINPLLKWTCQDIWNYLHQMNVSYCSLYKRGYV